VNASRRPSRDAAHHSGLERLAKPSPWRTFTSYSLPACLAHSESGQLRRIAQSLARPEAPRSRRPSGGGGIAEKGQLRTHAPQSTAQSAHGRLKSEIGACDAMALTIANDNFRGRHLVLMRAAKTTRASFLASDRRRAIRTNDMATRARQTSEKYDPRVAFAAYDREQITALSVSATPLRWQQRSNRWRKTKKITSTAALRWNA
jgi:hypothetical protein